MKNNISYYRHETGSTNHWKFKVLRKRYGWAGEGKFWALNNMIADAEGCVLDLRDESKMVSIAIDLDFEPPGLKEFIQHLLHVSKLVIEKGDGITTEIVQETFGEVMDRRDYQRKWKNTLSNSKTPVSNSKTAFSTIENQQSKVKEIKVNKTKEKEREDTAASQNDAPPYPPFELESFKQFEEWIIANAPRVASMKQPFTIRQYLHVAEKYKDEPGEIRTLLSSMHNWQPLLDKNHSAYVTLLNWKSRGGYKHAGR